jgi:hypothetical protein
MLMLAMPLYLMIKSNKLGELQMRKAIIITSTIVSIMLILDSLNAGHAFVMFLLAGVIPGTNIAISASRMLEVFTLLIGFTLSRITLSLIRLALSHQSTAAPKPSQHRISTAHV